MFPRCPLGRCKNCLTRPPPDRRFWQGGSPLAPPRCGDTPSRHVLRATRSGPSGHRIRHSGGGFITADALLRAPFNDFFKVGIAESGNHDQRQYEDDWGERYQGALVRNPDGTDSYAIEATQTHAAGLKGRLPARRQAQGRRVAAGDAAGRNRASSARDTIVRRLAVPMRATIARARRALNRAGSSSSGSARKSFDLAGAR